jgi:uncharacterized protein YceK
MERIRQVGRVVVVLAGLVVLGGCASIPQRAWQNGANLHTSRAHYRMMQGDHSFQNMRQVYSSLDAYHSQYTPAPYQPFGRW